MANEKLEQLTIALPPALLAFVERQAKLTDHTTSGAIRHLIAMAARQELPPPPAPFGTVLENVPATPEGIAAARAHIAALRTRRAKLARLGGEASAASDMECEQLKFQIEVLEERVAQAERMMRPTKNGG
jgi:hypothetical protein